MKYLLFISVALLSFGAFYLFNNPFVNFKSDDKEGIQFFRGSWSEAKAMAKKENKPIFLDVYTTWCGYCKKLKSNTFSDKRVAAFYNEKFINVTLDGEQPEGAEIVQQYQVQGYPALLFFNANGEAVTQTGGYHTPKEFLQVGKEVVNMLQPSK